MNNYQLLDQCVEIDVAIENIQAKVGQKLTKMSNKYRQTINVSSQPSYSIPLNQVQKKSIKENLGKGVELEMVYIPAGEFMMGSNEYYYEKPIHKVTLQDFYIGKYPVTQAQYQAVMDENPSYFKGENNPVEKVNWNMAQKFCQKLSENIGRNYQLPSESQWEYACRAGNQSKWCFGDDENQLKHTMFVGSN